jgi:hypothetical protein
MVFFTPFFFLRDPYDLQASEKTHERLKIMLLEYLNTNRSSPDSMNIIPFLLERIRNETNSDKARACAVLGLSAQKLIAKAWNAVVEDSGSSAGTQLAAVAVRETLGRTPHTPSLRHILTKQKAAATTKC